VDSSTRELHIRFFCAAAVGQGCGQEPYRQLDLEKQQLQALQYAS
jgi:hypothetical protein